MMAKLYRFWICPPVVERARIAYAGQHGRRLAHRTAAAGP